jgi:hypothetical protein
MAPPASCDDGIVTQAAPDSKNRSTLASTPVLLVSVAYFAFALRFGLVLRIFSTSSHAGAITW